MGKLIVAQMEFCEDLKLMLCFRSHSVYHDDRSYNVHCFATEAGAKTFVQGFGGEWFDPKDRGRPKVEQAVLKY